MWRFCRLTASGVLLQVVEAVVSDRNSRNRSIPKVTL